MSESKGRNYFRQPGREFVYPRSEAMRLAQVNNRPVASMPDNTNSASERERSEAGARGSCNARRPGGEHHHGIRRAGTLTGAPSAVLEVKPDGPRDGSRRYVVRSTEGR